MLRQLGDFILLLYKPLHTDEMKRMQIHQLPLSSHGSRQMQYQKGHLPDSYCFSDTCDHVFKLLIMPR